MKEKFSPSQAIRFGWDTVKQNFWFFALVTLSVFAISLVSQFLSGDPGVDVSSTNFQPWTVTTSFPESLIGGLLTIGMLFVSMLVELGIIKIALTFIDKKKAKVSDLVSQYHQLIPYVITSLLYGAIVFAGLLLLIVPGIYWAIKYAYFPYFLIDEKADPLTALRKSGEITKGAKWDLLVFGFVLSILNLIGFLALGIGMFFTYPATFLANAFAYRQLRLQTN